MLPDSALGGIFSGAFGLVVLLLLVILTVLWFLLPFAVFGINSKLRQLVREAERTNELLKAGTAPDLLRHDRRG